METIMDRVTHLYAATVTLNGDFHDAHPDTQAADRGNL
jgi:hypothetical protein